MTKRFTLEDVSPILERLGFDPVEPYPGNVRATWQLRHRRCGRVVGVKVKALSHAKGSGCRSCSATDRNRQRDPMTGGLSWEQRARAELAQVGMEPLEPYPGMQHHWLCIHTPCGTRVPVMVARIRAGRRACPVCGNRAESAQVRERTPSLSHAEASAVLEAGGFQALERYPGARHLAWRARHEACGQELVVSLAKLRLVREICPYCRAAREEPRPVHRRTLPLEEALATMAAADLEPMAPYPGHTDIPWLSRHLPCGRVVTPRLVNLRAGHAGCAHCAARWRRDRRQGEERFRRS